MISQLYFRLLALGYPIVRARASGSGPLFTVKGFSGELSAFGLARLAEGLEARK